MSVNFRKPLAIIAVVALTLLLAVSTAVPAFAAETAATTDSNLQIVYDEPDLGEGIASDNYITLPEAPAKDGYTFRGWRVNGGNDLYNAGDVVVKDGSEEMHLQPVYEQAELDTKESLEETTASEDNDLNFSSQYDSPIEIERDHDSILIAPEAKEKGGYAFYGWSKNGETPLYLAGERIEIKAGEKVTLRPVYVSTEEVDAFTDKYLIAAGVCFVIFCVLSKVADVAGLTDSTALYALAMLLLLAAFTLLVVGALGGCCIERQALAEALQQLQYMTP